MGQCPWKEPLDFGASQAREWIHNYLSRNSEMWPKALAELTNYVFLWSGKCVISKLMKIHMKFNGGNGGKCLYPICS